MDIGSIAEKCGTIHLGVINFKFTMLLSAFLVGEHENASTLVLIQICAYVIVAGQIPGNKTGPKPCKPCNASGAWAVSTNDKQHKVGPDYQRQGFVVIDGFLSEQERANLLAVVNEFHQQWLDKNAEFYAERAINSAYLTASTFLNDVQRQVLFNFIGSQRVMTLAYGLLGKQPAFMNTQLFFDPTNPNQKNYWHRDNFFRAG